MYRLAALFTLFALIAWAQLPLQNTLSIQPVKQPTLKAKPHTSKFPAQKIVPKQESSYLLRSIISNRGQGKLTSMVKTGSLLVIGGQRGLRIEDVSDPRQPKELYFSIHPNFRKCMELVKLDDRKILLWREGKRRENKVTLQCCGVNIPAQTEVFTVVDISDPKRPRVTMQKLLYLMNEEDIYYSLFKKKEKAYPPVEIGKKIGETVLDDGDFGFRRTLIAKGNDIYLCGTFGIAQFKHGYEQFSGNGGSVVTDSIKFINFFKFRDNLDYERLMQDSFYKKYKCKWFMDFSYAGGYMSISGRHVITPFVVLDRDLKKLPVWKRNCNKPVDECESVFLDGVTQDEGEWLYLFEIVDIGNGYCLKTYKVNREGALTQIKNFEPQLYKKFKNGKFYSEYNNAEHPLFIRRADNHLFLPLNVVENGENYKIEMLKIEPDKSLKTERIIHIGPHKVVDVDYEEPYLYVLSPDAVRIYELKPKND